MKAYSEYWATTMIRGPLCDRGRNRSPLHSADDVDDSPASFRCCDFDPLPGGIRSDRQRDGSYDKLHDPSPAAWPARFKDARASAER